MVSSNFSRGWLGFTMPPVPCNWVTRPTFSSRASVIMRWKAICPTMLGRLADVRVSLICSRRAAGSSPESHGVKQPVSSEQKRTRPMARWRKRVVEGVSILASLLGSLRLAADATARAGTIEVDSTGRRLPGSREASAVVRFSRPQATPCP